MGKIIDVKNISKKYGQNYAVDNVTLHMNRGEIYGLIGLNGAGKTTLIRLLLGLIKPTNGNVYIQGEQVTRKNSHLWEQVGSIVETSHAYPELTVFENLEVQRKLRRIIDSNATSRVINELNLTTYKHKKVKHLSLGNKQRVGIAKALLHRPRILLLDEPTNGLDPEGIVEIRYLLQRLATEEGVTILISSHILTELAKLATTIGIIHDGKLVKQISTQQLQTERLKKLIVDSPKRKLLKKTLDKSDFKTAQRQDNSLEITTTLPIEQPETIAQLLVQKGVPLAKLLVEEETLEQYFLRTIHQGAERQ